MENNDEDIFQGIGVEIKLKNPDDFLKVRETLTRIGVASRQEKILYQSCHILHKRGRYVILHFKELFKLDGKPSSLTEEDIGRRNTISHMLSEWGLIELLNEFGDDDIKVPVNKIKVLPFKEKKNWTLEAKYKIGVKKY